MVRLIGLHETNKWDDPSRDTDIFINAEHIVSIKGTGFADGRVTQIDCCSPLRYFVREGVDEVRSLINSHRERYNKYND